MSASIGDHPRRHRLVSTSGLKHCPAIGCIHVVAGPPERTLRFSASSHLRSRKMDARIRYERRPPMTPLEETETPSTEPDTGPDVQQEGDFQGEY